EVVERGRLRFAGLDGVVEGQGRGAAAGAVVDDLVRGGVEGDPRRAGDGDRLAEVDLDRDHGAGRVRAARRGRGDRADRRRGRVDDDRLRARERVRARRQRQGGVVGRGVLDRAAVDGERVGVEVVERGRLRVAGLDGVVEGQG